MPQRSPSLENLRLGVSFSLTLIHRPNFLYRFLAALLKRLNPRSCRRRSRKPWILVAPFKERVVSWLRVTRFNKDFPKPQMEELWKDIYFGPYLLNTIIKTTTISKLDHSRLLIVKPSHKRQLFISILRFYILFVWASFLLSFRMGKFCRLLTSFLLRKRLK